MAQYKVRDNPDMVIECPFDNTHMIRVSRMPYHIMDCKKNHKHLDYKQCPYNARHWIPAAEYKYHIYTTCPDKVLIEGQIIAAQRESSGSYFHGDCSLPEYTDRHIQEPSGENWDDECDNERAAFTWGNDDASEYFSRRPIEQQKQQQQPLRIPHGAPRVLQNHTNNLNDFRVNDSSNDCQPRTQRLPNSLPMTHKPVTTSGLGGLGRGRGRGYGSLQQGAPQVGGVPQQVAAPALGGPVDMGPARRGVGRGYGQSKTNGFGTMNGNVPIRPDGNSDEDACSTSSTASMSSSKSGSSTSRSARPRMINAPALVTQPITTGPSSGPPITNGPSSGPPLYGLQGIGRGAVRKEICKGPPVGQTINSEPLGREESPDTGGGDVKRRMRRGVKKLREIEGLEAKRDQGVALNQDETTKVEAKGQLLTELENLRVQQD